MQVGVYGLGRFGAFWAEMLATRYEVVAANRSTTRNTPVGVRRGSVEDLAECDALFLCVAISAMEPVLEDLSTILSSGTLVFDTCSVKMYPVELMQRILPAELEIIGTHPMFGPDSAREPNARLPLVYSPVRVDSEKAAFWHHEFEALGLEVHTMSAEEHDRIAASTQGITHLIGRVLGELQLESSPIATLGYTRILQLVEQTCNDPEQLFLDLQRHNPYTANVRQRLRDAFERIADKI